MVGSIRVGVRDTYAVVFRTKSQDGVTVRTSLRDGFGSRGDRPLCVPTFVDTWPEAV